MGSPEAPTPGASPPAPPGSGAAPPPPPPPLAGSEAGGAIAGGVNFSGRMPVQPGGNTGPQSQPNFVSIPGATWVELPAIAGPAVLSPNNAEGNSVIVAWEGGPAPDTEKALRSTGNSLLYLPRAGRWFVRRTGAGVGNSVVYKIEDARNPLVATMQFNQLAGASFVADPVADTATNASSVLLGANPRRWAWMVACLGTTAVATDGCMVTWGQTAAFTAGAPHVGNGVMLGPGDVLFMSGDILTRAAVTCIRTGANDVGVSVGEWSN